MSSPDNPDIKKISRHEWVNESIMLLCLGVPLGMDGLFNMYVIEALLYNFTVELLLLLLLLLLLT